MEDLHTKRLTPEFARVAMESRVELGRMLEARVPETWPGADPTRLIVHTANRTLIGETGFHRPPDASGTVEVGFSIVPEYRGRGFASEATRALIDCALAHSVSGSERSFTLVGCPRCSPGERVNIGARNHRLEDPYRSFGLRVA